MVEFISIVMGGYFEHTIDLVDRNAFRRSAVLSNEAVWFDLCIFTLRWLPTWAEIQVPLVFYK